MTKALVLLPAACALAALSQPAIAQEVTITLTDVRPGAGPLYVSLQTEGQFLREEGVAGMLIPDPHSETITVTLPGVPAGRYSFTAWHDIDGDGVFTMGPTGPLDGWAMVDAAGLRGMPTFAAQSFVVGEGGARVTEAMLYPEVAR